MGERAKKLIGWTDPDGTVHKGWADYYFGTAVDGISGNCAVCVDHHRKNASVAKRFDQLSRKDAMKSGKPMPVSLKVLDDGKPPCHRCPKHKLDPDHFGLDPRNQLSVKLYLMAAAEQRVGTMAGAFLLRTLNVSDAIAVLDEYREQFPTWLHRQRTLESMLALDRVATRVISEKEELERKRAEEKAKSDAKRGRDR